MTIQELKIQIVDNKIDNLLIFYGDEYMVQKLYVQKIAEVTQSDVQAISNIIDIKEYALNGLIDNKWCFVCTDSQELLKSSNLEREFEKISQILGENTLILQFTKMDKRSKLYNYVKDMAVEFSALHPLVLEKYLMKAADIQQPTAKKLSEICEYDYGRCLLELDKVKHYSTGQLDRSFKELLDKGVIYAPPGDKIFDFVGAVLSRNTRLAFELLDKCKDIGEPSLRLLLVLFTNIRHLLQVQACKANIQETTGLSTWEIRNVQSYQGVYRNSELVKAMTLIQKAESGIKMGKIDEQIAVEYVLVNIL